METTQFLGVLGAVLLGNGLSVVYFYALFWSNAQAKRGVEQRDLPWWAIFGMGIPPLIGAVSLYFAFY